MDDTLSREVAAALPPLPARFYQRPTAVVAEELLGAVIVRRLPEGLVAARIVEVEAYLGVTDPACHTFGGRRTRRTEAMWGEAGCLYVYFTYGMHWCTNLVTGGPGIPEAVLLRAAEPLLGGEIVRVRRNRRLPLLEGPARLSQGLGIDGGLNGCDVTMCGPFWVSRIDSTTERCQVHRLPRIGVAYAGQAASWPLRFRLAGGRRTGDGGADSRGAPGKSGRRSAPGREPSR